MPTNITVSRKTPATKLVLVQKDAQLLQIIEELEPYLTSHNLNTVIVADLAALLGAHHQVTTTSPGTRYMWWWDPTEQKWVLVCVEQSVITINDDPAQDPIEVIFERGANYG